MRRSGGDVRFLCHITALDLQVAMILRLTTDHEKSLSIFNVCRGSPTIGT